jgi:hypothetical protein
VPRGLHQVGKEAQLLLAAEQHESTVPEDSGRHRAVAIAPASSRSPSRGRAEGNTW